MKNHTRPILVLSTCSERYVSMLNSGLKLVLFPHAKGEMYAVYAGTRHKCQKRWIWTSLLLYCGIQVPVGGNYESCCVVVRNMDRCVYAVPSSSVFPSNTIAELEQLVSSDQPDNEATFRVKLQVRSIYSTPNLTRRDLDPWLLSHIPVRVRKRDELSMFPL